MDTETTETEPTSLRSNSLPKFFLLLFVLFILFRFLSGAGILSPPHLKFTGGGKMVIEDLETLDGNPVALSDWEGKVVVVNFWATWCPPCVRELPSLVSLREKTRGKGMVVVCVSQEDPERIRRFVEKKGFPSEMFLRSSKSLKKWVGGSIPITYILDPRGEIKGSHRGSAAWDDEEIIAKLTALLSKDE